MKNFVLGLIGLMFGLFIFAVGLVAIAIIVTYPKLPELDAIKHYQPKEPLTIYSADGVIIGTYGEERRAFTTIDQFPQVLTNAVIAAEDKRFREHWGVDVTGIFRAVISNLTGGVKSGASTITQQVARNFYLSNERTFTRKFNEALLAYKIERTLNKDQILELYFNQIYLGQRAYGFASAAKIYFNKDVRDLTLAEASILAGLPKAPSAFNPIVNPQRARLRQEYILNNMVDLGMITPAQRTQALNEELRYERHRVVVDQNSLYVAEMVRQEIYERYGEEAYNKGFKVYTTVHTQNQKQATTALRRALRGYGLGSYQGAEQQLNLQGLAEDEFDEEVEKFLSNAYTVEGLIPAVVIAASGSKGLTVQMQGGEKANITPAQMGMARGAIGSKKLGDKALQVGSVIRVVKTKNGYTVSQQPPLQGAVVSIDSNTGAILALVGGYDFHSKAFNRANQGRRQPGSTFKPFVYSAALSKGMGPNTLVNDAPIKIGRWSPKNSDGNYAGMIPLSYALAKSKNTVSVRLVQSMGVDYVHHFVQRFGFSADQIPAELSLSLGTGSVTPLQMAEGYAVFANGGYKVSPYVIDKIYDSKGNLRAEMQPLVAGQNAPRAIDERNAYLMNSMLKGVITSGTGSRARAIGRNDVAGKTGTTNDNKDAWFVGYNPKVVTAVYIGFDRPKSMGRSAFGGTIALPVWVDYMRYALNGKPVQDFTAAPSVMAESRAVAAIEEQGEVVSVPKTNLSESSPSMPVQTQTPPASTPASVPAPQSKPASPAKSERDAIDALF